MSPNPKPKREARVFPETTAKRTEPPPDLAGLCRSIFDGSPLPTAMVEGAGYIVRYVNPAFCLMASKNKGQLTGIPFAEIMPRDACLSVLERVHRTGEAEGHSGREQSEAHPVYWSYEMWPVLGEDERPVGIMVQVTETAGFHRRASAMNQELLLTAVRQNELAEVAEKLNAQLQREITERKRMEQALINSEKLSVTARLAATMAHEINNPLEAITNLIFLLGPLQNTSESQSYLAELEKQIKGLSRIATQMLKFHRDVNQPAKFKLSGVLREVLDFYRPNAERQGVVFNQRIETEGSMAGFRGEIAQVVTNLLLNALAATPAGGKVTVHLYPAPNWLCEIHKHCGYCLSVADTGGGIDAQHRARIFEPFFTTKGVKGTGLGLWLCAGIVSRAGGSIRVRSTCRPGRSGTCFSIFLPTEEATSRRYRRRYEQ